MNIKMNNFVGNIPQISFTPVVTSCYQEHALNADVGFTYLRTCYATLSATGAETSLLFTVYCIE